MDINVISQYKHLYGIITIIVISMCRPIDCSFFLRQPLGYAINIDCFNPI